MAWIKCSSSARHVSSTGIEIVGDAVDAGIAIARGPATRRTPTPDRARARSRFIVVAIATRATRLVCQILYQQGEHEHRGQESEPEQKTRKVIIQVRLPCRRLTRTGRSVLQIRTPIGPQR